MTVKKSKLRYTSSVRDGVAVRGGGVPALKADEEDEIEIEFGNLRSSLDVENEAPEITNFSPEHERAFDDADVEYTFSVTDAHSGLPEAEDLPDRRRQQGLHASSGADQRRAVRGA